MPDAKTAQHRAEELASLVPPLMVAAERVASTVAQGVHGRRRVGTGEAFWQFRQYQPGDSLHRVDWRQTAKRDRVYVSCGAGFLDVFETGEAGYRRIDRIRTVPGTRTSLFVPELDRLFLAVRASAGEPPAIWVYRLSP